MRAKSNQRGEGRTGMFVALVIVGIAAFLAFKFVPVKINAYEFRETLREEAKYASAHRNYTEALDRVLEKAESLGIPITAKQINIRKTKAEVTISAQYEQAIDLTVTTYTYKFNEEMSAPLF